jgi:hypothetical protein
LKERAEAAYPDRHFSINSREDGMQEDPGEDGKIKNNFRFK